MKNRCGETEYYFAITLKDTGKVIGEIDAYMLVRKLIECVRVVCNTEIQIIFKGGKETTVNVEK